MGRVTLACAVAMIIGSCLPLLSADAQVPPVPDPDVPPLPTDPVPVVGDTVNPLLEQLVPLLENESGEDLHSERIDLELLIDIRNIDYSLLGILFGGGKVDADVRTELGLDFSAVSAERLDAALQAMSGDANMSLNNTFGIDSSRLAITAEEIRLIGGGVLLEAFQSFQEQTTRRMIESMLPGIVVLQADFEWSQTMPASEARQGEPEVELRDPPIHLDAALTVNYLERYSAWEIVQDAMADKDPRRKAAKEAESELKRQLAENQTVPPSERNAFMFMGYGQLLDLDLPRGWRLNLTMQVPKGFTIEGATDELVVDDDHTAASYYVDGSERSRPFQTAGVVTVSNRFLVTATAVVAVLLVGTIGRLVAEAAVLAGHAGALRLTDRRGSGGTHADATTDHPGTGQATEASPAVMGQSRTKVNARASRSAEATKP